MKRTVGVFLVKLGIAVLFAATAAVTLFFAYGYRFDVQELAAEKTSIIDVVHKPVAADVLLDGQKIVGTLPIQIKGVLPGVHTLRVEQEELVPWQRDIRVLEDVVTIVRDVLLVPERVEELVEEVFSLEEGEQIYFGPDAALVASEDGFDLRLLEFFADGTVREEEVPLFDGKLTAVEMFPSQRFLLKLEDGRMVFVSFGERQFKVFRPFDGVDKILVDSHRRTLYFLADGELSRFRYDEIHEEMPLPEEREHAVFLTDVSDFTLDDDGRVLAVSGGKILVDGVSLVQPYEGVGVEAAVELEEEWMAVWKTEWKNVAVVNGSSGDDLLIVRTVQDARYLFLVPHGYEDIASFRLLTRSLQGTPFFFGNGDVLYGDTDQHIFTVTRAGLKQLVLQSSHEVVLLGPYAADGHFLVREGKAFHVRDVYDSHFVTLFPDLAPEAIFLVPQNTLFYFQDASIKRLLW